MIKVDNQRGTGAPKYSNCVHCTRSVGSEPKPKTNIWSNINTKTHGREKGIESSERENKRTTQVSYFANWGCESELGLGFEKSSWRRRHHHRRSSSRAMRSQRWGSRNSRRSTSWSPAPPATLSSSRSSVPTLSWLRAALFHSTSATLESPSASSVMRLPPSSSLPATNKVSLSHSFLFLFYSIVSVWLLRKSEKWRCCLFCVEQSHIVVWIIKSSVDYKLLCAPIFFYTNSTIVSFYPEFDFCSFLRCLFVWFFFLCLLLIGLFFCLISEFLFLGLWKINAILMGIRILMIEIKYPL